jgi:methyl coenzyme M reductase subunit C
LLEEKDTVEKIVLLNALVSVSDKPAIIISMPTTVENIKELVRRAKVVESYIGHESTAKLLTMLLGREIPVNRGMYTPENKDLAVVVRLKKRLEKVEDVKNVKPEDIEFLLVKYYTNVDVVVRKH